MLLNKFCVCLANLHILRKHKFIDKTCILEISIFVAKNVAFWLVTFMFAPSVVLRQTLPILMWGILI